MYSKLNNQRKEREMPRRVLGEVQNFAESWDELPQDNLMSTKELFYLLKGLHEKQDRLQDQLREMDSKSN